MEKLVLTYQLAIVSPSGAIKKLKKLRIKQIPQVSQFSANTDNEIYSLPFFLFATTKFRSLKNES